MRAMTGIPITLVRIHTRDGVALDGVVAEPRRRRDIAMIGVHGLGSVFSSVIIGVIGGNNPLS